MITIEVPIEFSSKIELYSEINKRYVGLSIKHSMCIFYTREQYPDGSKVDMAQNQHPCRVTDDGIQFYDGYFWKFFDNVVQEAFAHFLAEKELLEK
jgi:hypothetical protein